MVFPTVMKFTINICLHFHVRYFLKAHILLCNASVFWVLFFKSFEEGDFKNAIKG